MSFQKQDDLKLVMIPDEARAGVDKVDGIDGVCDGNGSGEERRQRIEPDGRIWSSRAV